MKTIISILLAFCVLSPFVSVGQSFSFHSNSPFGISLSKPDTTRNAQKIMFADYDNDGDMDLFLTGLDYLDAFEDLQWEDIHSFIEMQENIGTRTNPQFGPRKEITNNFPYPVGYFMPAVGDINGDHKSDLIISSAVDQIGNSTPLYLKNIGASGANNFEILRFDSMSIPSFVPQSMFIPELVDLDADGDLDVLMTGFDPAFADESGADQPVFRYARNVSNQSAEPEFEGWYSNPYGLVPHPNIETLIAGDVDNDGDVDLLGSLFNLESDSISRLYLHVNSPGANNKPNFSTVLPSPFGMPTGDENAQLTFPTLVDLDGDGDLDLFVLIIIDGTTTVAAYYTNNLCQPSSQNVAMTICEGDVAVVGNESFSNAGNYTVHLESAQHCDSIVHLTLSVIETVSSTLDAFICQGESYSVGNESFNAPGSYMIHLVTASGCDSLVFLTLNVLQLDNSVILQGNTITSNQSFAAYQWFNCDTGEDLAGETGQSLVVTTSGNFGVHVESAGCTTTSACTFVMITGIEDNMISPSITLYPNPTSGMLRIDIPVGLIVHRIQVYTAAGVPIREFNSQELYEVDLTGVAPGLYFVRISTGNGEVLKRVVVL